MEKDLDITKLLRVKIIYQSLGPLLYQGFTVIAFLESHNGIQNHTDSGKSDVHAP